MLTIKPIEEAQVSASLKFQTYDTVKMETPDGKMVDVLQPRENISKEECQQRIQQAQNEIDRGTAEVEKYQAILTEIEKL